MIKILGEKFTQLFLKYMPDAFVFAILLTLLTAVGAFLWSDVTPLEIVVSWYRGFFDLLEFSMQIILIVVTGFSIALSPVINRGIDRLSSYINTPKQVYFFVVLTGMLLSLISFGWVVVTCVLARELAIRVKGIHYPFLIACVYFSVNSWVSGLSSSVALLLNTPKNFLIEKELLTDIIPTSFTLGSPLNMAMLVLFIAGAPLLMLALRPRSSDKKELQDLLETHAAVKKRTIKEEALHSRLPFPSVSDSLNNSSILQLIIVIMGFTYILFHFITKGVELNFNIMIFIFLIVGLLLHKTPMRYVVAMKRSCSNVSGIIFQYPFYAGIMGIMLYTGLGENIGKLLASFGSLHTYPFFAYLMGGFVNFAIPSAGGEFAVIGPSLIKAVNELGAGLTPAEIAAMISRASMAVAYGESISNMLQPFYLLLVMPVMAVGTQIQARDIMGYLVIPFILFFTIQSILVVWMPL